MQLIKLDAIDSTNGYLKNLMAAETPDDYTTVVANSQTDGRGQMGAKWYSEAGKNLTFSVLKIFGSLPAKEQFLVTMASSLAVTATLQALGIPEISIKWPNDIMSGPYKLGGILIENVVKGKVITAAVIGIGLNVNQMEFKDLPNAASMRSQAGKKFSPDEVLLDLIERLKGVFKAVELRGPADMRKTYESRLFLKDVQAAFSEPGKPRFTGVIRGISPEGKLLVERENGIRQAFGLREIRWERTEVP